MHREKQILLGLLGLLCGGFVAVLGAKLFIPRPPAGSGPDIDAPPALVASQLVVEPPSLSASGERPAPLPPPPADEVPPAPVLADRYAAGSRFATPDDQVTPAAFVTEAPVATTDEPATAAPLDPPPPPPAEAVAVDAIAADTVAPTTEPAMPAALPPPPAFSPPAFSPPGNPLRARAPATSTPAPLPRSPDPAAPLREAHVTVAGDSWWSLAERAYGEGRYYRALYAWNRTVNPPVSLVPGTRLEIPPVGRLEAAWPRLVPAR
jgi:hypothetical protein